MSNTFIYPDPLVADWITRAIRRLEEKLTGIAPTSAKHVIPWMHSLGGVKQPADYFTHPLAWPMFALPYWVEKSITRTPDLQLHAELVFSCVSIYYYIRLIDDVMDGDFEAQPKLLPAAAFFHTQWQSTFTRLFPVEHPFWADLERYWFETNDFVLKDGLAAETTLEEFIVGPGRKVHAAKIPILAVCYRHNRMDVFQAWLPFYDKFSNWHQMLNDVSDWLVDHQRGRQSYFLTEAKRRQRPDESLPAWMLREGFPWASELLRGWLAEMRALAFPLQHDELNAYLDYREMLLEQHLAEFGSRLPGVVKLLTAFGS